jgi:hypothetical protein
MKTRFNQLQGSSLAIAMLAVTPCDHFIIQPKVQTYLCSKGLSFGPAGETVYLSMTFTGTLAAINTAY